MDIFFTKDTFCVFKLCSHLRERTESKKADGIYFPMFRYLWRKVVLLFFAEGPEGSTCMFSILSATIDCVIKSVYLIGVFN